MRHVCFLESHYKLHHQQNTTRLYKQRKRKMMQSCHHECSEQPSLHWLHKYVTLFMWLLHRLLSKNQFSRFKLNPLIERGSSHISGPIEIHWLMSDLAIVIGENGSVAANGAWKNVELSRQNQMQNQAPPGVMLMMPVNEWECAHVCADLHGQCCCALTYYCTVIFHTPQTLQHPQAATVSG